MRVFFVFLCWTLYASAQSFCFFLCSVLCLFVRFFVCSLCWIASSSSLRSFPSFPSLETLLPLLSLFSFKNHIFCFTNLHIPIIFTTFAATIPLVVTMCTRYIHDIYSIHYAIFMLSSYVLTPIFWTL